MSDVLFNHTLRVWTALFNETEADIWEGSMGALYKSCNISMAYYSKVWKALQELGCIDIQKRSRHGSPSVIRLVSPPNLEEFNAYQINTKATTKQRSPESLDKRVTALEERLRGIDLTSILIDFESRLSAIEKNSASNT